MLNATRSGSGLALACGLPLLLSILAGCAQSPEAIEPAYVSPITYSSWSCEQIAAEQARLSVALANASTVQQRARSNDTVGVVLVGLPLASMSGQNVAPQIARYKGEQNALQAAAAGSGCR